MADDDKRALLPIGIAVVIVLFVLSQQGAALFTSGVVYAVFGGIALLLFSGIFRGKFELIGIAGGVVGDALFGAALGLGFFVIQFLVPAFSIAVPPVPASLETANRFLIIVIAAPILEEAIFRGWLVNFLGSSVGGKIVGVIGSAVLFSLFHFTVYGGLAFTSALVSAGLFGVAAASLALYKKSLVSTMVMHGVINAAVILPQFVA